MTVQFGYDVNNLMRVTDLLGRETTYTYDSVVDARMLTKTRYDGVSPATQTYDDQGRVEFMNPRA